MFNPETFGPGAGWFDFDGDGRLDLLCINGNVLRGSPDPAKVAALYHNRGDGTFEDVTARAGLDVPIYGMGFAAADVDNDGDQDLLLYGLHRSLFFLNDGAGSFRDATVTTGLHISNCERIGERRRVARHIASPTSKVASLLHNLSDFRKQ